MILPALRVLVTLAAVALAAVLGWALWQHYMLEPWTRDARVRADVVTIAPDVSGVVVDVRVRDNQQVAKGQVLFTIDQERYRLALVQAEAQAESRRSDWMSQRSQAERREQLGHFASAEERERVEAGAAMARAAYDQALAARDVARLNLERTEVKAPVEGYVTNLSVNAGDYATAGKPMLAVIDRTSFWVSGYFEETKIQAIHEGDPVTVELLGSRQAIAGHVEGVSRAIADRENRTGDELLADVNPTFTWVRLAQRIPVRIRLDQVPEGVRLVAGMTCTVTVTPGGSERRPALLSLR